MSLARRQAVISVRRSSGWPSSWWTMRGPSSGSAERSPTAPRCRGWLTEGISEIVATDISLISLTSCRYSAPVEPAGASIELTTSPLIPKGAKAIS